MKKQNKVSQSNLILNYLKTGKELTPLEALNLFGCLRLGARIYDLKKSGYKIVSRFVSKNEKIFSSYKLIKK